jgi:hypothetical protein
VVQALSYMETNAWQTRCENLVRALLNVDKNALHDVKANTYPDIGKYVAKARQIMCVVTPFLNPVLHSLSSLHSKSDQQMLDLNHDRNHVLLGSGNLIFFRQSHFQTLANGLLNAG